MNNYFQKSDGGEPLREDAVGAAGLRCWKRVLGQVVLVGIICVGLSGCLIPPNERDYVTAEAKASSVAKQNEWPYTSLTVGGLARPVGDFCPYYFVVHGEKVALAGLSVERIRRLGGRNDPQFRRVWGQPKNITAMVLDPSCHFLLVDNKLVEAKIAWSKDEPVVGLGRVGIEQIYFLPLKESEVQELFGPPVKIREIPQW